MDVEVALDNLQTVVRGNASLGSLPSYATICRYMKAKGLLRQRRRRHGPGETESFVARERRSFEVDHVHGLWHFDFHEGSRPLLLPDGTWIKPKLCGVIDDHSRLCCHAQWYLDESTESLVHCLCQAILKRGLPRAMLSDNGAAMLAAETIEGFARLGILVHHTLPYSPEQNAKQENFWARVEGRLIAMLEGEPELTLALLNQSTQAWVEQEYHREKHSEIGTTPLDRYLHGKNVGRESPSTEALRRAFRMQVSRVQRRSDGTVTVEGVRFEVPARYRTLTQLILRVARWDLSQLDLVDPREGRHLCTLLPIDKSKNADAQRRALVGHSRAFAIDERAARHRAASARTHGRIQRDRFAACVSTHAHAQRCSV